MPPSEPRACVTCRAVITAPRPDAHYCMQPDCQRAAQREYTATKRVRRGRITHPIPQPRGDLPPIGKIIADDDGERVQCHVCGEFYGSLARHSLRTHGIAGDVYRERYGLTRKQSLDSPAVQAANRARAIAMDARERLTQAGNKDFRGRPRGTVARTAERVMRHDEGIARKGSD